MTHLNTTRNPQFGHLIPPRDKLMAFAFRPVPVFRMGYDAHVRAWGKIMKRKLWDRYHADQSFAARYDARVCENRRAFG